MEDAERVIVVDAANVVGSRPDGWWRDRAGAARRLLGELTGLRERLPDSARVVVVLEGAAKAAVDRRSERQEGLWVVLRGAGEPVLDDGEGAGLRVMLAGGSGDDAIVEVVAAAVAGGAVTVVTADRGLRARVEALGATTVGPSWLRNALG
ncbi:hypothetical protein GLP40_31035 [Nocardia sp. CT2-14]|uniref:NTP pyrophosphohydrolase n=1 Tax=Nocardia aurantiaca TaxID=2675850 RepID=A0A6I3L7Z9_9NOCA|nr:hypothetical protein [Nocardia aurantiaca]